MRKGQKIFGYHKIRDGKICILADKHDWSTKELAKKFNLTETRIQQILLKNKVLVPIDKEYERKKRIRALKQEIKKKYISGETTKKDLLDVYEQLRKELGDDKPLIDQSQHTHLTIEIIKDDNDSIRKQNRDTFTRETARSSYE